MAKTLLNAVNEVLKKNGVIQGDSGELTSLSDSPRQTFIDVAVQVINEGIDDLYTKSSVPKPNSIKNATLTLVTGTVKYSADPALVTISWPMRDSTNGNIIDEYPGGYYQLLDDQVNSTPTGLPLFAAYDPADGAFLLDSTPTATENGNVYNYKLLFDLGMTLAADTVPFDDDVFRAMVPAWSEMWRRVYRNPHPSRFGPLKEPMAKASRMMIRTPQRTSWYNR